MVHSKVKTMKYAMLVLAGLWLAACADERGFRPKQFPATADQAQNKTCTCDAKQSTQAPVSGKGDQLATTAKPVAQDSNAPAPTPGSSVAPAPVQHKDEALDHTIHTIVEQLEPGADQAQGQEKFYKDLTPSDRALQVIKGMDINQIDASGNGVSIEVKAVINDDGGDDKLIVASGVVPYGVEKLTPLQSETKNVSMQAFFCSPTDCGSQHSYLRVYMHVFMESGETVTAVFMQAPNGQYTVINSSIRSPFPSVDSVYSAKSTMQAVVKSGDTSQVKGDPTSTVQKASVRTVEKAGEKDQARLQQDPGKDQARLPQEPNSKSEKAVKKAEVNEGNTLKASIGGFRRARVIHDNDDTQTAKAPADLKPLSAADAQKAMDEALKAKATTLPSNTLPADAMMQSAQLKIAPAVPQEDAKKAFDTALAQTMQQLTPKATQEANKDAAPAAQPAKEAAPQGTPEAQPTKATQADDGIIST